MLEAYFMHNNDLKCEIHKIVKTRLFVQFDPTHDNLQAYTRLLQHSIVMFIIMI